ncbi:hypothetical protein Ddye_008212 [Dipteronia dyeriana]|uniref:Uncharacterized protein n=1 Tax=Dipteronia dyeriana TaxID=168575 RepID=A0AAD9X9D1_9ROSI|nr:hypothetical protein Ddye_008212 [Dipteronia dyeriana]
MSMNQNLRKTSKLGKRGMIKVLPSESSKEKKLKSSGQEPKNEERILPQSMRVVAKSDIVLGCQIGQSENEATEMITSDMVPVTAEKEIVTSEWEGLSRGVNLSTVLNRINNCGALLNNWNMKKREAHQKDIMSKRKELKLANKSAFPQSWIVIRCLEDKLDEALCVEEKYWCQRVKVDWMKSGDRNSRFFHSKASTRNAHNWLGGLTDDSSCWVDSKQEMEKVITNYFSKLFMATNPSQDCINRVLEDVQSTLSDQKVRELERIFLAEDVRQAVFDMSPLKALGKDGLLAPFYQK